MSTTIPSLRCRRARRRAARARRIPPAAVLAAAAVLALLGGCTSSGGEGEPGFTYGSGPGHTRPRPQTQPPSYAGLPGVRPRSEPLSRGGNKYFYTVLGKCYEVWHGQPSYVETGIASWYGPGFHGNRTANGEIYDQKGYSAAHKNLPLPSYLKVTNLSNHRSMVVRVNDRGPFHGPRILDLSEGAAIALDMTREGTARVRIEYIDVGNNAPHAPEPGVGTLCSGDGSGGSRRDAVAAAAGVSVPAAVPAAADAPAVTYLQILASGSRERAAAVAAQLRRDTGLQVEVQPSDTGLYRVMAGPLADEEALGVLRTLQELGYEQSIIRRQ